MVSVSSQCGRDRPSADSSSQSRRLRPSDEASVQPRRRRRPSTSSSLYHRRSSAATDWVMLEIVTLPRNLASGAAATTRVTSARTSSGLEVSVSLALAAPPASSQVYLHLSAMPEDEYERLSTVVAADGDLLLLCVLFLVQGHYGFTTRQDYFVYKGGPLAPSLNRLPPLVNVRGEKPWCTCVGVARYGEEQGSYVVAAIKTFVRIDRSEERTGGEDAAVEGVAKLCVLSPATNNEWEEKELAMPRDPLLDPLKWDADAVFPFYPSGAGAAAICWACLIAGLLICDDVYSPTLRFVPFPVPVKGRRGHQLIFRNAGVSGGLVRFIDIDNSRAKRPGFSVTTWTLLTGPETRWRRDAVLNADDLWKTAAYRESRLPRRVPAYPTVDRQDPDALHVALAGRRLQDRAWMLTIDMKTKTLKTYMKYRNGVECANFKDIFYGTHYVSSDLPKHLE